MSVSRIEHVLVLSDDIDRSRDFYQHVVGLRTGERPAFDFTGYWMYAGQTPCLHIADRDSYRAHAERIGLEVPDRISGPGQVDHIAFGANDYGAVLDRLARADVQPVRRQMPGGPCHLFFEDPDGQRVEINVREAGGDG
jgi:catechol 2,3-dioxygenase-like lactoylglutathione lyase family enzyme